MGIPAVSNATRYGMRNAPPPFSYATPGNRQMFPRPTAEPIAAMMNAACPVHCSRGRWNGPGFAGEEPLVVIEHLTTDGHGPGQNGWARWDSMISVTVLTVPIDACLC